MAKTNVGRLVERVAELSTLPEVTQRILAVTEDPDSSARDLHEVLKHDMALSAKLLRVVNSAFYGLPGRVADLDRAIVLLGFQAVRNLAIAATMAALFRREGTEVRGFSPQQLWQHSVATGVAARQIVGVVGLRSLREEAFLGGIIHDIGVVVLYQYAEEAFAQVVSRVDDETPLTEAEDALLDMGHPKTGQALAERWKFPRNMQLVAGYHHLPDRLAEEHRLLPVVIGLAGDMAEDSGYGYLDAGRESAPLDSQSISESINLGADDRRSIQDNLPSLVEQASGWLDL